MASNTTQSMGSLVCLCFCLSLLFFLFLFFVNVLLKSKHPPVLNLPCSCELALSTLIVFPVIFKIKVGGDLGEKITQQNGKILRNRDLPRLWMRLVYQLPLGLECSRDRVLRNKWPPLSRARALRATSSSYRASVWLDTSPPKGKKGPFLPRFPFFSWHSLGNLDQRTERRGKLCIMGLISTFSRITGNPIDHCQGIEIRTLEPDGAQFKASVRSCCPWPGCCPSPVSSWMDNCLHRVVIGTRQTGVP